MLGKDVARMNRLVDQLLRVARLDAVALDVSALVDLSTVARDVVAHMAPFALANGRSLAAQGTEQICGVRVLRKTHFTQPAIEALDFGRAYR